MTLSTKQAREIGAHLQEALASARRLQAGVSYADPERRDAIHNVIGELTNAIGVVRTCWCGESHKEIDPPTQAAPPLDAPAGRASERSDAHEDGGAKPMDRTKLKAQMAMLEWYSEWSEESYSAGFMKADRSSVDRFVRHLAEALRGERLAAEPYENELLDRLSATLEQCVGTGGAR